MSTLVERLEAYVQHTRPYPRYQESLELIREAAAALRATGEAPTPAEPLRDVGAVALTVAMQALEEAEDMLSDARMKLSAFKSATHPAPQQPDITDEMVELCREARKLQREYYGDGSGLHLAMIDWAREYDAAAQEKE